MSELINLLLTNNNFPHEVTEIRLIETHISYIILTGKFAYKIKKSIETKIFKAKSLNDRITLCKEELRVNKRLSKGLYIGLAVITGSKKDPKIKWVQNISNQKESIHEVAVVMNQFDNSNLLSICLSNKKLNPKVFKEFAIEIGKFHLNGLKTKNNSMNCSLESYSPTIPAIENIDTIKEQNVGENINRILDNHLDWINQNKAHIESRFRERSQYGCIRECHGDLHSDNIFINSDLDLVPFDSLEFNPLLRWIDPISEMAFLYVDLLVQDFRKEAIDFLNYWLETTGDYISMDMFKWYSAYRSMVRAKTNILKINQSFINKKKGAQTIAKAKLKHNLFKYISHASSLEKNNQTSLIIMHGLSGSGKSFISKIISREILAIRIRSDVERKRLIENNTIQNQLIYSLCNSSSLFSNLNSGFDIYSEECNNLLFHNWIPTITRNCCLSSLNTIIDATFLRNVERRVMKNLANELGVNFIIIRCQCNDKIAKSRIDYRNKKGIDPSEADFTIRSQQKSWLDPISDDESKFLIDYNENISVESLLIKLKQRINL